jgi:hypothetical protein
MREFQNEFQAAYYTSSMLQMERNHLDIPDGMFAVVGLSLAYCQFTDATLRNPDRRVIKLYGSRRIADHVCKTMNAKLADWEGCEAWYEVYPKAPQPVLPAPTYSDDEIPF